MMSLGRLLLVVFAILLPQQVLAQTNKHLDCGTGPVIKTLGGTSWLVRSCDGEALLFITEPGNPAFPFYFLVYPSTEKGRYTIEGEGTGDKQASAAAAAELRRISEADVAALIAETKRVPKSN